MNDTSIHEAGHAVAGELLGIKIDRVWARPDMASRLLTMFPDCDVYPGTTEVPESTPAIKALPMLVAGCVAVELHRRGAARPVNDDFISGTARLMANGQAYGADLSQFKAALRDTGPVKVLSYSHAAEMLLLSCRQAADLLKEHWPGVLAVATMLDTGRVLSGDDVRLYAGLPPRPKRFIATLQSCDLTGRPMGSHGRCLVKDCP